MKLVYLLALLFLVLTPAYAYNSGFRPVYQPPAPPGGISNIHDIGNVTSIGCAIGEFLSVNASAIWDCAIVTGSTDTNTAQIVSAGGLSLFKVRNNETENSIKGLTAGTGITMSANTNDIEISTDFQVHSITCGGFNFISSIDNSTGTVTCSTPSSSGITTIASAPQTTAVLIADNSTITNKVVIKTLTQSTGITLTNGSNAVTVATNFKIDNQSAIATDSFLSGFDNATGDWGLKTFSVNTQTCSSQFVTAIDNQTGEVTCTTVSASGGATSLAANVTTTARGVHTQVFSIPLTANSGNAISSQLVVSSTVAGAAVIAAANLTNNQAHGWCLFETPTSATANTLDFLLLNTTGNAPTTLETTWLPVINDPQPIFINCAITTGSTAGNLRIFITPELTTNTATAKAGSYYLKTP